MSETVLVVRTCDAQMRAVDGFVWPRSGPVEALDWRDDTSCGGGLHGLLWGDGDGTLVSWEPDAQWLVVEVLAVDVRDLGRQIKFRRGVVVHCGTRETATRYVAEHGGAGLAIVGGTATAGHFGTATAGDNGTAMAGHYGTATAGDGGTATAGHNGTATAGFNGTATAGFNGIATAGTDGTATVGHNGTATAGFNGTATAGFNGTATAGHYGTATAGDGGTATAGHNGTATAGFNGTATAGFNGIATAGTDGTATVGDYGTATAGENGTATAGKGGMICVRWWDKRGRRYRIAVGYVGENGIAAGVAYRCDAAGRLASEKESTPGALRGLVVGTARVREMEDDDAGDN